VFVRFGRKIERWNAGGWQCTPHPITLHSQTTNPLMPHHPPTFPFTHSLFVGGTPLTLHSLIFFFYFLFIYLFSKQYHFVSEHSINLWFIQKCILAHLEMYISPLRPKMFIQKCILAHSEIVLFNAFFFVPNLRSNHRSRKKKLI
jgi:hypothetical protein